MPNLLKDTLVAIRAKLILNILSVICSLIGWTLLLVISWKLALAMFLIRAGSALYTI